MARDTFPRRSDEFVHLPRWRLTLDETPLGCTVTLSSFTGHSHRFETWNAGMGRGWRFPSREAALREVAWGLLHWDTERAYTAPTREIEVALSEGVRM